MGQNASTTNQPRNVSFGGADHQSSKVNLKNTPHQIRTAKSASTTTVPSQYAAQTDRKYNNLKIQYNELMQEQDKLKHVNSDLQSENEKQAKMSSDLLSHQSKNIATIKQLQSQIHSLTQQNQTIQPLKDTIASNEQIISDLKIDLANAQQTILSMTSIVDVNQKLPTVNETILKYQSIRDQQHADTCTVIKKFIKRQYPKWQKYYIAQTLHEIMFTGLILTYNAVKQYKNTLFRNIANQLNLTFAIQHLGNCSIDSVDNDETKLETEQLYIEKETNRILHNMLGAYFKNNYEHILKKEEIMNPIVEDMINKCVEWNKSLRENEMEYMRLYISKCCEICWVMLLQEPVLEFWPLTWECREREIYNDEIHKKVLGSDRKCDTVLYYVWPAISRGSNICGTSKIDVVVKHVFYEKIKEKRQSKTELNELVDEIKVEIADKEMEQKAEVMNEENNNETVRVVEKVIDEIIHDVIEKCEHKSGTHKSGTHEILKASDIRSTNETNDNEVKETDVIVQQQHNENNQSTDLIIEADTIIYTDEQ